MKQKIYAVYGVGGFAREILPLVRDEVGKDENSQIYFVVDEEYLPKTKELNSIEIISFNDFLQIRADEKFLTVGFSNLQRRIEVFEFCKNNNIHILNVKATNAVIMNNVQIDNGYILSPFTTLTSNIKIGVGFQANLYSYVAHDCMIGNFVTFAPGVKCNGHVEIGNNVYVGSGVIIHPGKAGKPLKIGHNSVIAAGSVVTKNIPNGMKVFGNPAIEFTKENIKRRM